MIHRQFLSTLLWLIGVNLLIKVVFVFGIDMQVQHRVGQSVYGLYFVLLNLTYIFQIIHDFGLNLLHGTDTAHHGRIRHEQWVSILRAKVVLSLLYSVVVMGVALALGYGASWHLWVWLVVNNILISWIAVLRSGISGMARYNTEAVISVMDKGLMILVCGALLLGSDAFRIEWFVWAQTGSLVITALVAWWVSRSLFEPAGTLPPMKMGSILRNAFPFSLAVFLMFVYTRTDSILLEKLLPDGAHEAGIYAAGFRLLDAANMIAFLFTPLLIPMYARLRHDTAGTSRLIRLAGGVMICMAGSISIAGFWWARDIIWLCYGQAEEQWVMTFRFLILAHIPVGLMYVFGSYMTALRHLRPQNILFMFSVTINVAVNLYAIPKWGTVGAAATAFITQAITAVGLILLAGTFIQVKDVSRQWIMAGAYFILAGFMGWLFSSLSLPWWMEALMFAGGSVTAAFVLKLLHIQAFLELLRQRMT